MSAQQSNAPKTYLHVTNMQSPIDQVDMGFLSILADYRIGPPKATPAKNPAQMTHEGIFGVYTTREALSNPQVLKLSGFTVAAIGVLTL